MVRVTNASSGDVITHIQDQPVGARPSLEHVIARIKGRPGSFVSLTIHRRSRGRRQESAGAAPLGEEVANERSGGSSWTAKAGEASEICARSTHKVMSTSSIQKANQMAVDKEMPSSAAAAPRPSPVSPPPAAAAGENHEPKGERARGAGVGDAGLRSCQEDARTGRGKPEGEGAGGSGCRGRRVMSFHEVRVCWLASSLPLA